MARILMTYVTEKMQKTKDKKHKHDHSEAEIVLTEIWIQVYKNVLLWSHSPQSR